MVRAQPVSAGAAGVQIFNLNTVETFLSLFLTEIFLTSFLQGVFFLFIFHNANLCLYVTGSEKRGHFAQIPNFGFKTLITLKL